MSETATAAATLYLLKPILASSEFVSQPTLGRLSIPVQHSSASANFYEKALFVKGRRGGLLSWPSATASALRAMLLSALVVSQLSSDSVHRMRSVLIRAPLRYCNLPSVLSSLRG